MASLHDFGRREGAARRERRERRRAGASGSLDIKRVRTREACAGPYAPHARILANTCTRERELRCVALGSCSLRVQRARRSKAPPRGWRRWCGVGASRSWLSPSHTAFLHRADVCRRLHEHHRALCRWHFYCSISFFIAADGSGAAGLCS